MSASKMLQLYQVAYWHNVIPWLCNQNSPTSMYYLGCWGWRSEEVSLLSSTSCLLLSPPSVPQQLSCRLIWTCKAYDAVYKQNHSTNTCCGKQLTARLWSTTCDHIVGHQAHWPKTFLLQPSILTWQSEVQQHTWGRCCQRCLAWVLHMSLACLLWVISCIHSLHIIH